MKITTSKFDLKGKEILVGDHVTMAWGFDEKGTNYMYHQVNMKQAHLMSNDEWHDDADGVIFCLGQFYNFWEGREVIVLSDVDLDKLKKAGIPPDTYFSDEPLENKGYNTPPLPWD